MDDRIKIGNYICCKKKIGRGSFSKVFKGYHNSTKKKVAIKMVELDEIKHLKSFMEREIEVMKYISHPNILELYDVIKDTNENCIYLILEYCQKGDLSNFLNKRPLKEEMVCNYIKQLAKGLKYLIDRNIIHRDLKPQNILISDSDEIKITDFGFARYYKQNEMVETICGSPLYMAPEIMKKKKYKSNVDLWSVGIIMYEMLTGYVPFKARTPLELIQTIENTDKVKFPSNIEISEDCKNLLNSLLQKNPDDRISWSNFFKHPWLGDKNLVDNQDVLDQEELLDDNSFSSYDSNISLEDIDSINSDNENYGDSLDSSNNVSVIKKSEPIDIPNTNSNIIHNWCSNSTPKYNNSHLFNQFSNNAPSELIGKNEKKNIEEEFVILEDKEIKNTDDK